MRTVTLDTDSDDDIAVVMQRRAGAGHGGDQSYQVTDDEELRLAWSWCSHVTDLVTSGHMRVGIPGSGDCNVWMWKHGGNRHHKLCVYLNGSRSVRCLC